MSILDTIRRWICPKPPPKPLGTLRWQISTYNGEVVEDIVRERDELRKRLEER